MVDCTLFKVATVVYVCFILGFFLFCFCFLFVFVSIFIWSSCVITAIILLLLCNICVFSISLAIKMGTGSLTCTMIFLNFGGFVC